MTPPAARDGGRHRVSWEGSDFVLPGISLGCSWGATMLVFIPWRTIIDRLAGGRIRWHNTHSSRSA